MYYVTTIQPDNSRLTIKRSDPPTLGEIKKYWGEKHKLALIEQVPMFNKFGHMPCVAFCDEEGKLGGRADLNVVAQYLWMACNPPTAPGHDLLVGPVTIVAADTQQELWKL